MAVKNLISPGIGFSPGSVKFIVTRGLLSSAAAAAPLIQIQSHVVRLVDITSSVVRRIEAKSSVTRSESI